MRELGGRRAAFTDRALYLAGPDALVVADLHVGRGEASNVAFPLGEAAALRDRLAALVDRFGPATVVLAGDVLHSFSGASDRDREALDDLAAVCRERGASVVPVAGNHDTALAAAWDGDVCEECRLGGVVACHGHAEPAAEAAAYVVGHDHPAVEIEGRRRPCLLYGEGVYRGADLYVLPAFTPLAGGAVVNGMCAGDFDSPLVRRAGALRPVVADPDGGDALLFPPLDEFRELL
jgi:putative SbcD/Mre11-related phosphoesterase